MTHGKNIRTSEPTSTSSPLSTGLLQRKCACGQYVVAGEECADCQKQPLKLQRRAINQTEAAEVPQSSLLFPIQTKLTVNTPGDVYEREADAIAEKVMHMSAEGEIVQPAYSVYEQEQAIQRKGEGEFEIAQELEQQLRHSEERGQPLPSETQIFMNHVFDTDFSQVRVHTCNDAAQMNRKLNANAFTYGTSIFFGAGNYHPASTKGRGLLAHELTHVTQQCGKNVTSNIQRQINSEDTLSPLRLVFYQGNAGVPSFHAHAEIIAGNLGALRIPYSCNTGTPLPQTIGSIYSVSNDFVLERAARYARCFNRKVEQVHVVGHVADDPPACLKGIMTAEIAKWYLPSAKVVVHGCKGLDRFHSGTSSILRHLPKASVYVHQAQSEAGGPLNFFKVSIDANSTVQKEKIQSVISEEIGFTQASIEQWAETHVNNLKQVAENRNQNSLENYMSWLTNPAFASEEAASFAQKILDDKSNLIPANFKRKAGDFLARQNAVNKK